MAHDLGRRSFMALGAGAALLSPVACSLPGDGGGKALTAAEDLMREHGVLRRALLVYDQVADRLRTGDVRFDARVLTDAARLFRDFGEDFHQRMLEEAFIFPRVARGGGEPAKATEILAEQHERGREITDYLLAQGKDGRIAASTAPDLARALRSMVLMYGSHSAREDVIVFPAWKALVSDTGYREAGEEFAEIERKLFGQDAFADADRRIGRIEQHLGLADLASYTAPVPPAAHETATA